SRLPRKVNDLQGLEYLERILRLIGKQRLKRNEALASNNSLLPVRASRRPLFHQSLFTTMRGPLRGANRPPADAALSAAAWRCCFTPWGADASFSVFIVVAISLSVLERSPREIALSRACRRRGSPSSWTIMSSSSPTWLVTVS